MRAIERLQDHHADIAIVLGSGLNSLIADVANEQIIPYTEFSEISKPTVPGHLGRFVLSQINKTHVIYAQGRVHLYEGHSAYDVGAIVRLLALAGIKRLILTNAAGAVNPKFKPGDWMMITDHINLTGTSPLVEALRRDVRSVRRETGNSAQPFVDLTDAYSPHLRENFRRAAKDIGMILNEGVYAGNVGPQYETPAEVRMLQKLGADAVGMSTVLEAIQARALGIEVAGFSCITNLAAGISKQKLSHEEVLETGKKAAAQFDLLLRAALHGNAR